MSAAFADHYRLADPFACEVELPPHAQDVSDDIATVEMHLADAGRVIETALSALDGSRECVRDDPDGFTRHHAVEWRAIMLAASELAGAAAALAGRVGRA